MTKEKKSITRALVELKTINDRIYKKMTESLFIGVSYGKYPVSGFTSNDEAKKEFEKNFKSLRDLIDRRRRIKSAITKSNAITELKINNEKMTVSEAIERKRSIEIERDFIKTLSGQYSELVELVEEHTSKVDEMVKSISDAMAGRNAKLNDADLNNLKKIAETAQEATLIDPNKLREQIDTKRDDVDSFLSEVDIALSESNTKTEIEI